MKTFHRKLKIYQLWKCVGVGGVHGARVRVGERVAGWVWVDGLSFQPVVLTLTLLIYSFLHT